MFYSPHYYFVFAQQIVYIYSYTALCTFTVTETTSRHAATWLKIDDDYSMVFCRLWNLLSPQPRLYYNLYYDLFASLGGVDTDFELVLTHSCYCKVHSSQLINLYSVFLQHI